MMLHLKKVKFHTIIITIYKALRTINFESHNMCQNSFEQYQYVNKIVIFGNMQQ
jgi:hypothetical protein